MDLWRQEPSISVYLCPEPSKLGATGSNPVGRAIFSAISAGSRCSRAWDIRGTERQRAAQRVTLAAQSESHSTPPTPPSGYSAGGA